MAVKSNDTAFSTSDGFVNVPAVAVVIVGAGFVGASFINTWYRRRRNN